MAQYVKQGNIFGRIGSGIGKGFAEQGAKELERSRLTNSLKAVGDQKDLSPFQRFTGLVGAAHEYPQVVQSGERILNQDAYLNSLRSQYGGEGDNKTRSKGYLPSEQELRTPAKGEIPTLATTEDTAESYKTFIPPTEQEERRDAFENFNKNPARYEFDFDKALKERKAITSRNQEIQKSHQDQEKTAVGKEETVKDALKKEVDKLGLTDIPPKAYQKFEEKALNSILAKKEGGEGLTQENAIKKYSKEAEQAYRSYKDLGSLSAWSPLDFNRRVNALQKDFASRGEQQLMMDQLISDYQLSPIYAAHKAYPIKNDEIPTLNELGVRVGSGTIGGVSLPKMNDLTYEKLKKEMGKKNSPLSIAYELQQKRQNPRGWLNYLNNHRDDLEVWQADQLTKNLNVVDLKDMWLRAWE